VTAPPLPGRVRQVGFVVRDFESAIQSWLAAGVGPWFVIRNVPLDCVYRGAPCEVTVTTGLANIGDMQIELIAQHDATPSIYTEFLSSGREGYHQIAWWTDDFDAALGAATAAGWLVVWSGVGPGGLRFAYAEPAGGVATVYEISETNDGVAAFYEHIRAEADDWDGSDPIRSLEF
jgi:hypothetical protein